MAIRKIAAGMAIFVAGVAAPGWAAEKPKVVREALTIEGHRLVRDKVTKKHVKRPMPVDVAVYRPNDDLKHPAVVYLHGGAMSFADPVMDRFHAELASRGLVVLAPHYLLDGTGWLQWRETAVNTVTLAESLTSVDPGHIGMAGISMGGQVGLSAAARDPRIKAVAEFFTAWPGSLPDEPIAKLPPVLLLNGTADPIIPFDVALELDEILKEHKLPFERHVYPGLGHGFSTPAAFHDGVARTSAFFGGKSEAHQVHPTGEAAPPAEGLSESTETSFGLEDDQPNPLYPAASPLALVPSKKSGRLVVKKAAKPRAAVGLPKAAKP